MTGRHVRAVFAGVVLLGVAAAPVSFSAAPVTGQCYALVTPGKTGTCETTIATPPAKSPAVHAAFHMDTPAPGSIRIEWLDQNRRLLMSWECSPGGLAMSDRAATAGAQRCEATQHVTPIVPIGTHRVRVVARADVCVGAFGPADACSAHGKLTFS